MDEDVLTYHAKWTPEKMLNFFLHIFDPLGLAAPYVLLTRRAFQEIGAKYRVWDVVVPAADLND